MGVGNQNMQKMQEEKKSQEIHAGIGQVAQKQGSSFLPPGEVKTGETTDAVKELFEMKSETIESVEALKTEHTTGTNGQVDKEKESRIRPVGNVPNATVAQRRNSVVLGKSMSDGEKKRYIREEENWKETRQDNFLANFPQGLQDSNANLLRLTSLLTGDQRSASASYEKVRGAMEVLTNLCAIEQIQNPEELPADFASQYEFAYRRAMGAVEAYLQSHARFRLTYKGWQRKKWVRELQSALNRHEEYATRIISSYTDMMQSRDRFTQDQGQSEIEREPEQVKSLAEQSEQMSGKTVSMEPLTLDECYQKMLHDPDAADEDYAGLTNMLGDFLQQNYHAPKNRAYCVNLYWAILHTLDNYLKNTAISPDREEFFAHLIGSLDIVHKQMIEAGVMDKDETEEHLPDTDENVEFLGKKSRIPAHVQKCGNKTELQRWLDEHKSLDSQDEKHIRNRIRICERIESLEKAKRNVIPPACTVYRDGRKITLDEANRETDKFILEDVVQAHFQSHGNSCWSAVTENMFRQRGVFIHQADIRGYRDSGLTDQDLRVLSGDNAYEIDKIKNLVGRVMDHTALVRFSLGVPMPNGNSPEDRENERTFVNQLKGNLRKAIIDDHSAVGLNLAGHYLTFVGIEGDKLYFKNSLTWDENGQEKIDVNRTYSMTVQELVRKVQRGTPSRNKFYIVDLFWLKDIPADSDPTIEYEDKLDNVLLFEADGEYVLSDGSTDALGDDETMIGLNLKRDPALSDKIIASTTVYIPRKKS